MQLTPSHSLALARRCKYGHIRLRWVPVSLFIRDHQCIQYWWLGHVHIGGRSSCARGGNFNARWQRVSTWWGST
eukprot:691486-Amphidinium_carterae.1